MAIPIPSRDILPRPVDISTLYQGGAHKVDQILDQPGFIWKGLCRHGLHNASRDANNSIGRAPGLRGMRRGQGWNIQLPQLIGQENLPIEVGVIALHSVGGSDRGRGINWPSWYRRRPLQDITVLVEAVERRRAELNQIKETQQEESNAELQQEEVSAESQEISIIELKQEIGSQTPLPTVFPESQPSLGIQARKIIPKNADNCEMGSDFLTPQKRLLNSIDKVREVWLDDQKRLARTLSAKKAEREKSVRTLMSMR